MAAAFFYGLSNKKPLITYCRRFFNGQIADIKKPRKKRGSLITVYADSNSLSSTFEYGTNANEATKRLLLHV